MIMGIITDAREEAPVTALLYIPTGKCSCDTSALKRTEASPSKMTAEEAAAAADIVERIARMRRQTRSPENTASL